MAKTVHGLLAIKILKKDLPDEEAPANDCVFFMEKAVPNTGNFGEGICT